MTFQKHKQLQPKCQQMSWSHHRILLRAPEKQSPWKRQVLWKVRERQRSKEHILHRTWQWPPPSPHSWYITDLYFLEKPVQVAPASQCFWIERPISYKQMNQKIYIYITVKFQNKIKRKLRQLQKFPKGWELQLWASQQQYWEPYLPIQGAIPSNFRVKMILHTELCIY